MAEHGYEMTPKRAKKALKFLNRIQKKCRRDPESIKKLIDSTPQERISLRQDFAELGHELLLSELDDLIDIIAMIYRKETE